MHSVPSLGRRAPRIHIDQTSTRTTLIILLRGRTCICTSFFRPPRGRAVFLFYPGSGSRGSPACQCEVALAAADRRFDVATFDDTPDGSDPHFGQAQFDQLNFVTTNGHFLCMGTDQHRPDIKDKPEISWPAYADNLLSRMARTPARRRRIRLRISSSNFTSNGTKPTWLVLNEISGSHGRATPTIAVASHVHGQGAPDIWPFGDSLLTVSGAAEQRTEWYRSVETPISRSKSI